MPNPVCCRREGNGGRGDGGEHDGDPARQECDLCRGFEARRRRELEIDARTARSVPRIRIGRLEHHGGTEGVDLIIAAGARNALDGGMTVVGDAEHSRRSGACHGKQPGQAQQHQLAEVHILHRTVKKRRCREVVLRDCRQQVNRISPRRIPWGRGRNAFPATGGQHISRRRDSRNPNLASK